MVNIVLCGGSGTRLWPISRTMMPKQFIKLFHERSLFQLTLERNRDLCESHIIVANQEHYFLALDQYEELSTRQKADFVLEPLGKNTASAIAVSALLSDPEEVLLVTPSDHLIKKREVYEESVRRAERLAKEGYLVVFGIEPEYPESGYGYIEAEDEEVVAFHEKPDQTTAQSYLKHNQNPHQSRYYWNSGMFCFKAGVILEELARWAPDIYEGARELLDLSKVRGNVLRLDTTAMEQLPEKSIDHAVMEHSGRMRVVYGDFGWTDLGSFDSLGSVYPKDEHGNTFGERILAVEAQNNFVYSDDRLIALVDVENLIVVDTPDALLISTKGASQKVREVVAELKKRGSELHNTHLTVHRPWGTYTVLEEAPGYKIKRIVVKPGKRLSKQKHYHRSEHWIVVSGTATVTVGDEEKLIRPNESTYIRMGETHRLENRGKIDVVLIEAQVGEYTGEDDIVRLDDDYHRD